MQRRECQYHPEYLGEMILRKVPALALAAILINPISGSQVPTPVSAQPAAPQAQPVAEALRPTYVLGPGDQILIRAFEADEISDKPFRVDADGFVTLPMVGRLRAGGLSVEQLESELNTRLKQFVRNPQVVVSVVQFRSEPVFFSGAFKSPGIYPLQGRRTLIEMLTAVGGLQPNASRRIKVTRRLEVGRIPLPNAVENAEAKTSTVEIGIGRLRESISPVEDIVLEPFDLITVDRAEMVYVNGEVLKVGAFELGERDSISVSQLLTLAGGLGRDAEASKARVLRPVLNSSKRAEIPIDLTRVLAGKDNDFPLLPNDLLYVPRSGRRVLWSRVGWVALAVLPTVIVIAAR
jgi:polysaccharide export outer membrane protein